MIDTMSEMLEKLEDLVTRVGQLSYDTVCATNRRRLEEEVYAEELGLNWVARGGQDRREVGEMSTTCISV